MSKTQIKLNTIVAVAALSTLLQASGVERESALHLGEKKPMPPQMVDYTKFDDVIELDCEEKSDYLNFAGAQMKPVVRVRVFCKCGTKQNQYATEVKYQDMWFKNSSPIGCKHFITLPLKERGRIGIFLKNPDTLNDAEIAACAAALVKLRLEATLNKNIIDTVRIPSYMYERMKLELQKQNFFSYREHGTRITTLIAIPLETDVGKREVMCFIPPTR